MSMIIISAYPKWNPGLIILVDGLLLKIFITKNKDIKTLDILIYNFMWMKRNIIKSIYQGIFLLNGNNNKKQIYVVWYNWNIVESGIKHHKPKPVEPTFKYEIHVHELINVV
jgi:hypothetical protein